MTSAAGVWRFDFQPVDPLIVPRCSDGATQLPSSVPDLRDLAAEWSFAAWEPSSRAVTLATDPAGVRPLYYSLDDRRLLWSTSLTELVRAAGASELDERYAAAFLSHRNPGDRTPYLGIRSVPPGHSLRITSGHATFDRYWDLPVGAELCLADERDYETRLLDLFRDALESRVRGHKHVCAELSGGLDSSSVVSMAAGLHAGLSTVSYTHPGAADAPFIAEVEAKCGLAATHLDVADSPFVSPTATGGAAPAWWEPRYHALARHLSSLGATALLTGQLGDLMMGNTFDDSDQVAGFLRRRELRAAGQEAYLWSRSLRIPIYPILWRALRMTLSSWTPEPSDDLSPTAGQARVTETSLTARLARAADEAAANPYEYTWRSAPPERRRRFRAVARMLSSQRLRVPEPLQHIAYAHPFADRRLVEFMLTVPPAMVCRPGAPRFLQRRAFRDILPERVLQRRSKASFGDVFTAALRPMAAEMLAHPDRLRTVERGYVDRATLLPRLERYGQGLDCNGLQLQTVILFEYWLRNRE
jgi:asparagine synthase (glutamine-hydrolysing)